MEFLIRLVRVISGATEIFTSLPPYETVHDILEKKNLNNMCVSYVGGKSKIAPQLIIPNIPKDIEIFVEPFSGQFWTFFKMKLENYPNLKTVIYNDFNPLNYNMYQCLKNHQRLLEECEKFIVQEKDIFPTNSICNEQFIKFQEEQSGTDKGLMGYPVASFARKPSDGRPFKNLSSIAGAQPRGGGGSAGGAMGGMPAMMKKQMKKD